MNKVPTLFGHAISSQQFVHVFLATCRSILNIFVYHRLFENFIAWNQSHAVERI